MLFLYDKHCWVRKENKSKITYPNCESAKKTVPHDETNPPPVPPADMTDTSSSEESTSDTETEEGDMYVPDADNSPHLLGQAELNEARFEINQEKSRIAWFQTSRKESPQTRHEDFTFPRPPHEFFIILLTGGKLLFMQRC